MKPRIFIGSSKEALEIAKFIKGYLGEDFDCFLWTDDIFKFNEGFLETLLKEASLFDFGILLFTKDDHTISRDKGFDTARDNVLFEYGLFLGRLGINRAFIIQEEGVKIPSDLFGITHARFTRADNIADSTSLVSELDRFKRLIEEKVQLGVLGLLPSTAIAIGYFYNFAQCVCDTLASMPEIEINGVKYKKYKFKIIIPNDLDADLKKRATNYFKKHNLQQYGLQTTGRSYPLYVSIDKENTDTLILYDMPTTLAAIDKAIELYIRKGHIGKSNEQILLELRELRNFTTVLNNLIASDAYCRQFIQVGLEE